MAESDFFSFKFRLVTQPKSTETQLHVPMLITLVVPTQIGKKKSVSHMPSTVSVVSLQLDVL